MGYGTLIGGNGAHVLNGGGNPDFLMVGAGNDRFVFDWLPTAQNVEDIIADFTVGQDKIVLEDSVFTGLNGLGLANALNPHPFFAGAPGGVSVTTARIFMDDQGSNLTFVDDDADGSGVGAAVLLAQVTTTATRSANDFLLGQGRHSGRHSGQVPARNNLAPVLPAQGRGQRLELNARAAAFRLSMAAVGAGAKDAGAKDVSQGARIVVPRNEGRAGAFKMMFEVACHGQVPQRPRGACSSERHCAAPWMTLADRFA